MTLAIRKRRRRLRLRLCRRRHDIADAIDAGTTVSPRRRCHLRRDNAADIHGIATPSMPSATRRRTVVTSRIDAPSAAARQQRQRLPPASAYAYGNTSPQPRQNLRRRKPRAIFPEVFFCAAP
ncbi:MAG TPA: hypothetical protein VM847_20810 [Tahibacter sp.]|nr:hypothetical protein [Tahibacter sp.]